MRYLLQAYNDRTATPSEEGELFDWLTLAYHDDVLKEHIEKQLRSTADRKFSELDWEEIYHNILKRTHLDDNRMIYRRSRWLRMAAAVLALLLVGGGLYWMGTKKQLDPGINKMAVVQYDKDIPPGRTQALLKAGGHQVLLDGKDTSFRLAGNSVHLNGGNLVVSDVVPTQYTLTTPRGGQYKVTLSDGSKVWLNADSKLIYPSFFTNEKREVTLAGEAYFDISSQASVPFIVKTAREEIRVLGTEFNVHAYANEAKIVTTLVSGRVRVNSAGNTLLLSAGQQAQLDEGGTLDLDTDGNIEKAIAWKEGYFQFDNSDIHEIMQQLSRWYDITVHYEKGLKPHLFGAIISRQNNISEILNMLGATGEVHFKIKGNEVTVTP